MIYRCISSYLHLRKKSDWLQVVDRRRTNFFLDLNFRILPLLWVDQLLDVVFCCCDFNSFVQRCLTKELTFIYRMPCLCFFSSLFCRLLNRHAANHAVVILLHSPAALMWATHYYSASPKLDKASSSSRTAALQVQNIWEEREESQMV